MMHWSIIGDIFQVIIEEVHMNKYVNASSLISIPNITLSQDIQDSILYAQLRTRELRGGSALSNFSTKGLQDWFITFFNVMTGAFPTVGDAGWRNGEADYGDTIPTFDDNTPQGGKISTKSTVQDILKKNVYDAEYFVCNLNDTDHTNMHGMVSDLSDALKKSESNGQAISIWDDNSRSGNNVCCSLSSTYVNNSKVVLFFTILAFEKKNCNNQFLWGGVDSTIFRGYLRCVFDQNSYDKVRGTIDTYLKNTTKIYVKQLDL